jgi:hypothetical protein
MRLSAGLAHLSLQGYRQPDVGCLGINLQTMEMVTAEIKRFARQHEERHHHHDNVEAIQLLDNSELLRRLNRTKPFELAN